MNFPNVITFIALIFQTSSYEKYMKENFQNKFLVFIEQIENILDPNYILVLPFDSENVNINEYLNRFSSPKIILEKSTENSTWHLKLRFSSNLLVIIFERSYFDIRVFVKFLIYNTLSKIIFISDENLDYKRVFKEFASSKFPNVIVLSLKEFQNSSIFYTYNYLVDQYDYSGDIFYSKNGIQKCRLISNKFTPKMLKFYPENTKNMFKSTVRMIFHREVPKAAVDIEEGELVYKGYIINILKTFVEQINGIFTPTIFYISNRFDEAKIYKKMMWDFMTSFESPTRSDDLTKNLIELQSKSDVIDLLTWHIIVPIPGRIDDRSLYFIRPYNNKVIVLIMVLIIYTPILLHILKGRSFWQDLSDTFNAVLSTSFNIHKKEEYFMVKFVFTILILFGFVLVNWYSALLGSFVTTFMYEKPLKTYEDIKKSGLKIVVNDEDWDHLNTSGFTSHDIFEKMESSKAFMLQENFTTSYGYAQYGDRWQFYFTPTMKFRNFIKFLKTDIGLGQYYLRLNVRHDSIWIQELNSFIHRIRAFGLYNHWTESSYMDFLYLTLPYFKKPKIEESVRALELNYFKFVFCLWFGGVLLSGGVFLLEKTLKSSTMTQYVFDST